MSIREQVDAIFAEYKESESIREFKEELIGNMTDRVASLCKQGLDENDAVKKTLDELGDITAIADELSLKKKQEVYSEMYMGTRKYLTPKRTALFVLGGAIVCFGFLVAAIVWFSTEMHVAALSSGMVFLVFGAGFLTYMCLTQETAMKLPMARKRATFYAISVAVFLFGLLTAPITYFATTDVGLSELAAQGWMLSTENLGFTSAISVLIPFALTGAAVFIFLCLTEKDRSKPWVVALREQSANNERNLFANAKEEERFGLFCGALWISAIALLVLLTIVIGIKYSWLAIVAALVGQMLMLAKFSKGGKTG